MRIIVCGGRNYSDRTTVARVLGALDRQAVTIVHGEARGADTVAGSEARRLGMKVEAWPADWSLHGKAAGPIRNQQMLAAGADLVIAFPGGRGTTDMSNRAQRAGIPVLRVVQDG